MARTAASTDRSATSTCITHTQLDAQATYGMPRGFQVVVSLLNLNNEVFGFYQGSKQYQIQREFYNRTVSVGVRMTR